MSKINLNQAESSILQRREFLKRTALGAGAVAAGMLVPACSSSSSSATPTLATSTASGVPSSSAWKFGVMADSQWLSTDDGLNPNTAAIGLIKQLNDQFIAEGVKFVVQVGDLADQATSASTEAGYATTASACEDTRALFAQALYASGIGFFPCRGNHDDGSAAEFVKLFPQTRSGVMNSTPASAFAISNPDSATQPWPAQSGPAFTQGSGFSTIGSPSANLSGLSYGFDIDNARLVFIDQFKPLDNLGVDGGAYSSVTTASLQQPWLDAVFAGKPSGGHLFVFSHKGLITQQHVDVLFGDCPADADFSAPANAATGAAAKTFHVAAGAANAFIRSMAANGGVLYFCGHDHNHNRSIVKTTDSGAAAQITHVLCQSVSSKFYTPNEDNTTGNGNVPAGTSNDAFFCAGKRQTQLSRELYTVGYYIVTVDGANVTVDYYSAPAYPAYGGPTENLITATPALDFSWRESFGYSLAGKRFVLANGDALTAVQDSGPGATVAQILFGTSSNPNSDISGRRFSNDVNTGWYAKAANTASDILNLWGMESAMGSAQTGTYVLSMSYDKAQGGTVVLATPDADGNWTNAVNQNLGGKRVKITGAYKSGYALGTNGIDAASATVWAVLNYAGTFAAVAGA